MTTIDAWPIVTCISFKSAPADRANDAWVCQRSCRRIVGRPSSAVLLRQLTARFQFSSPSREPFGDMIAGSPAARPSIRCPRIEINRSGIGTLRRPARLFGSPSRSRPDNCVIDLRTRIRACAVLHLRRCVRSVLRTSIRCRPGLAPHRLAWRPARFRWLPSRTERLRRRTRSSSSKHLACAATARVLV